MRAVTQDQYGTHEVLRIEEVEVPTPGSDEVRVRVHAAAIHAGDTLLMQGRPKAFRALTGLRTPRRRIPGLEVAGVVDAIGSAVTGLTVGDRVFGEGAGALAEYAVAKASRTARIPEGMSFREAASLPVSAVTGLVAMRDVAEVRSGQRVLVIGASGGVGSYAVQVATHLGAHVTAVCSGRNVEFVRSLGADVVVDYTVEDVAERSDRFDVILDNVASHPLARLRDLLAPGGRLLSNNGTNGGDWFGPLGRMAHAAWLNLTTKASLPLFVATASTPLLEDVLSLIASGAVRPVIGSVHSFDAAAEAVSVVESGHATGKVIVEVVPSHDVEGVAK